LPQWIPLLAVESSRERLDCIPGNFSQPRKSVETVCGLMIKIKIPPDCFIAKAKRNATKVTEITNQDL
jgi:hypothetical protein